MSNRSNDFPPTKWSTVLATRQTDPQASLAAMEELCRNYRKPLYAFARRKGLSPEDAEDLVQSFFEGKVIEARMFETARPEMGRLRSYILGAFEHFSINAHRHSQRKKRGGGTEALSLNAHEDEAWYENERNLADHASPEVFFDRGCALALLEGAIKAVRKEYITPKKARIFEALLPYVEATYSHTTIACVAQAIGLTEGAAKTALHRLRICLRKEIRAGISCTLGNPSSEAIDEELRALLPHAGNERRN